MILASAWVTFNTVVGAIFVLAGALGVLTYVFDTIAYWASKYKAMKAELHAQEIVRRKMARISTDACWFSEEPWTAKAIQRLAAGEYVADVRETWRKERRATQEQAATDA